MAKFKIFAGLNGGATEQGIWEFTTKEDAVRYAYDLAIEEYQSYEGSHGILSYDECYEDCLESEWIDPDSMSEAEIELIVERHYLDQIESWTECYVEEVKK